MTTEQLAMIATLVTALLGAVVTAYLNVRKGNQELDLSRSEIALKAAQDILKKYGEIDASREMVMRQLRDERDLMYQELSDCEQNLASAERTIEIYEGWLREDKRNFVPWKARDFSAKPQSNPTTDKSKDA